MIISPTFLLLLVCLNLPCANGLYWEYVTGDPGSECYADPQVPDRRIGAAYTVAHPTEALYPILAVWGGRVRKWTMTDCVSAFYNDFWLYRFSSYSWERIEFGGYKGGGMETMPYPRSWATLHYARETFYLLFGANYDLIPSPTVSNALLVRTGPSYWRPLTYTSEGPYSYQTGVIRPPPAYRHASIVHTNSEGVETLFTIGGLAQCDGTEPGDLSPKMEVWSHRMTDNHPWVLKHVPLGRRCDQVGTPSTDPERRCTDKPWTKGYFCDDASPRGRFGHVVWEGHQSETPLLYIFGGTYFKGSYPSPESVMLNDVWKFNAISTQWAWVAGEGPGQGPSVNRALGVYHHDNLPGHRRGMGVARWEDPHAIVIVGGYGYEIDNQGGSFGYLDSVWMWSNYHEMWALLDGSDAVDEDGTSTRINSREHPIVFRNPSDGTYFGQLELFTASKGIPYGSAGGTPISLSDRWRYGRKVFPAHCAGQGDLQAGFDCDGVCDTDYTGTQCEIFKCDDILWWNGNVCSGHGVCRGHNDCLCDSGDYTGAYCQNYYCGAYHHSSGLVCSQQQGSCIAHDTCDCNAGYFGGECQEHVFGTALISPKDMSILIPWVMPVVLADLTPLCVNVFDAVNLVTGTCELWPNAGNPSMTEFMVVNYTTYSIPLGVLRVKPQLRGPGERADLLYEFVISCDCYGYDVNHPDVCSAHGTCECGPDTCDCWVTEIPGGRYLGLNCSEWQCYGVPRVSTDPLPCSGHGICKEDTTCECSGVYGGDECELVPCDGLWSDDSDVCFGRGNCTRPEFCVCEGSFEGQYCELAWCGTLRSDNPAVCNGFGICSVVTSECQCYPGYDGTYCDEFDCWHVENSNDLSCNNGKCVALDTCSCGPYCNDREYPVSLGGCYTGRDCSEKVFSKVLERGARVLELMHEVAGFDWLVGIDPAFVESKMTKVGWDAYFNCSLIFRNAEILGTPELNGTTKTGCVFHASGSFSSGVSIALGDNHRIRRGSRLEFRYLFQHDWFSAENLRYYDVRIRVMGLTTVEVVAICVSTILGCVLSVLVVVAIVLIVCFRRRFSKERVKSVALDIDRELNELELEGDNDAGKKATLSVNKDLFRIDFDEIELIKKIGESNAVVWLGSWSGNEVAVKLFNSKDLFGGNQTRLTDFERETELLSSLTYPGVVKFYGPVLGKIRVGLVCEYLSGGDFRELILKEPSERHIELTFDRKVEILKKVSEAMRYIHSRNCIHRDLKLSNIMFDKHDNPKIIDFGMSRIFESAAVASGLTRRVGSSYYMAPECCLQDEYSSPVDVFSFGIIMYEVLLEKCPAFDNIGPAMELRIANDPEYRPKINEDEWEEVFWYVLTMQKCWQHMPQDRPSFDDIITFFDNRRYGRNRAGPPPPAPASKPAGLFRRLKPAPPPVPPSRASIPPPAGLSGRAPPPPVPHSKAPPPPPPPRLVPSSRAPPPPVPAPTSRAPRLSSPNFRAAPPPPPPLPPSRRSPPSISSQPRRNSAPLRKQWDEQPPRPRKQWDDDDDAPATTTTRKKWDD